MTKQFDAITYAQELEAAGVPKAQAEVHAKALSYALSDSVVLPAQLAAVQHEIDNKVDALRDYVDAKIDALSDKLHGEMREMGARLRSEMQAIEARLNARIDRLEERLKYMMWMNGLTLALVVGMLGKSWLG